MTNEPELQDIYELVRENNRMLHAMRRNAFWSGLLKFVIYAAFLIAPIWFYQYFMADTVRQMLQTVQQVQGTGVQAQADFETLKGTIQKLQDKIPGL